MRVLHLIDPSVPATAATLLNHLADNGEHLLWTLGAPQVAQAAGLRVDLTLPAPGWRHPAAWLALSRSLGRDRRIDLIHTLSLRGAAIAHALRPRAPILATLTHLPSRMTWLERRAVRSGAVSFTVIDESLRHALIAAGAAADRVALIEPAVDAARLSLAARRAMRTAWGVTDDRTMVVAALGDPPWRVDALEALLGVGLARETGRDLRVVISPQAQGLDRAARIVHAVRRGPTMLVQRQIETPWRSLPACDAALVLTAGLSAAWAMAAGLPIVAPATPVITSQLTDGRTALLAPPGKVAQLAQRLCRLHNDPNLARELGRAAQAEAARRYDPARFRHQWYALAGACHLPRGTGVA